MVAPRYGDSTFTISATTAVLSMSRSEWRESSTPPPRPASAPEKARDVLGDRRGRGEAGGVDADEVHEARQAARVLASDDEVAEPLPRTLELRPESSDLAVQVFVAHLRHQA